MTMMTMLRDGRPAGLSMICLDLCLCLVLTHCSGDGRLVETVTGGSLPILSAARVQSDKGSTGHGQRGGDAAAPEGTSATIGDGREGRYFR